VHVKYTGGDDVAAQARSEIDGIVHSGKIIEAERVKPVGASNEVVSEEGDKPVT